MDNSPFLFLHCHLKELLIIQFIVLLGWREETFDIYTICLSLYQLQRILRLNHYNHFFESVSFLHMCSQFTNRGYFSVGISLFLSLQVGNIIKAESDPKKRADYLQTLMAIPNKVHKLKMWLLNLCLRSWLKLFRFVMQRWVEITGQTDQNENEDVLKDPNVTNEVLEFLMVCFLTCSSQSITVSSQPNHVILIVYDVAVFIYFSMQINTGAATSLGTYFLPPNVLYIRGHVESIQINLLYIIMVFNSNLLQNHK